MYTIFLSLFYSTLLAHSLSLILSASHFLSPLPFYPGFVFWFSDDSSQFSRVFLSLFLLFPLSFSLALALALSVTVTVSVLNFVILHSVFYIDEDIQAYFHWHSQSLRSVSLACIFACACACAHTPFSNTSGMWTEQLAHIEQLCVSEWVWECPDRIMISHSVSWNSTLSKFVSGQCVFFLFFGFREVVGSINSIWQVIFTLCFVQMRKNRCIDTIKYIYASRRCILMAISGSMPSYRHTLAY